MNTNINRLQKGTSLLLLLLVSSLTIASASDTPNEYERLITCPQTGEKLNQCTVESTLLGNAYACNALGKIFRSNNFPAVKTAACDYLLENSKKRIKYVETLSKEEKLKLRLEIVESAKQAKNTPAFVALFEASCRDVSILRPIRSALLEEYRTSKSPEIIADLRKALEPRVFDSLLYDQELREEARQRLMKDSEFLKSLAANDSVRERAAEMLKNDSQFKNELSKYLLDSIVLSSDPGSTERGMNSFSELLLSNMNEPHVQQLYNHLQDRSKKGTKEVPPGSQGNAPGEIDNKSNSKMATEPTQKPSVKLENNPSDSESTQIEDAPAANSELPKAPSTPTANATNTETQK